MSLAHIFSHTSAHSAHIGAPGHCHAIPREVSYHRAAGARMGDRKGYSRGQRVKLGRACAADGLREELSGRMTEQEWLAWRALRPGNVSIGGDPHEIVVVDCGELSLPSGRLVAADPFVTMTRANDYYAVSPGRYPVHVTVDETMRREMYVSLLLSDAPEVARAPLIPYRPDGEQYPAPEADDEYGVPVDTGTVCFVDDEAVRRGMPEDETEWYESVFDTGKDDSWFSQMDAAAPLRAGLANIPLPRATDGANIILCHSGWGDGFYPVIGGFDAHERLVAVHIDLRLHAALAGQEEDEDAE